ncbi:pyrimidine/purine nucleoside phosphorylase [Paenibacillus chartarius]|uniref:Pyrimidine/purine nucleoside phosphorylase n=1 Tax=Paenibacillus chartarius TaxID=747481 RepID=A0ABV6DP67_9BACL
MSQQFDGVSIVTKANVYFDGKVTSRTVLFADGTKKTLGIMLPGEYDFGTDTKEIMEIQAGKLKVLVPGSDWREIDGSGTFEVPANVRFQLVVETVTDYICSYVQE